MIRFQGEKSPVPAETFVRVKNDLGEVLTARAGEIVWNLQDWGARIVEYEPLMLLSQADLRRMVDEALAKAFAS